ncbi:MAG: hypothetical protein GX444_16270 [Myxococcales bacterium]|nr:hypothetical protein [Myxococcales bacterium]
MPEPAAKRPSRLVTVLGALLGLLLVGIQWVLAVNLYLFPEWGRYLALGVAVLVALIYRIRRPRAGHEITFLLFFLSLYNVHMALGGYAYWGWWALPAFAALAGAVYLVFRRRDRLWRALNGLNAALFLGVILLLVLRTYSFLDRQERCRSDAARLPAAVRPVAGLPLHPYDFGGKPADRQLGVACGQNEKFFLLDKEALAGRETALLTRGIQRVTPHPAHLWLALPLWEQHDPDGRVYFVDAETGQKIDETVAEASVPGCRNLLEVEFLGDKMYSLCEVTHSLHESDAEPPFTLRRSLKLPSLDAYDLAVDPARRVAYVTDWAAPWVMEVDLDRFTVARKKWVGFSSYGIALGPDGLLYIAQMFHRRVQVLDPRTLNIVRTIAAGYGPRDLDFDPGRRLLLIGNYYHGTLDVVSLADGRRLQRLFVGELFRGLYFDQPRDRLFVAVGCGVRTIAGRDLTAGE